jgi:DNA-binding beta-propeller fold protein YncE
LLLPPLLSLEELRFYVEIEPGKVAGPMSDDALRDALREGKFAPEARVRLDSMRWWLPARAWATLAAAPGELPAPFDPKAAVVSSSPDLLLAPAELLDLLRFSVCEGGKVHGPVVGAALRDAVEGGRHRAAFIAPVGTTDWVLARRLFDRTLPDGARAVVARFTTDGPFVRCPVCLEQILDGLKICTECDEPIGGAIPMGVPSSRGTVPDDPEGASWLRLHWRPLVTLSAVVGILFAGIALRFLAPGRFQLEAAAPMGAPIEATCEQSCWTGESCQLRQCVWQPSQGARHIAPRPGVAGPFALPADASDVALVDATRFAVGQLAGVSFHDARTGQILELVSEAAQTRSLTPAGEALYAAGPQHVAVLDPRSGRVLKTLELGGLIGGLSVGASGRRAFVSLPGIHAVAILSTELHSELDRIRFGDDPVGPVATDAEGRRAIVTTGAIPLAGLPDAEAPGTGALYRFDPSRFAADQDRVRASMPGNPAAILITPDGQKAWIALRATNKIVPVELLPSGAVRQLSPVDSCDQPEQIVLSRRDRRALVRCARGRAVEVVDVSTGAVVRHLPFNAPVTDLVVSPDGAQAVVALPASSGGAIGLIDLSTFETELVPLTEPPTRLRLSPDGASVLVLSDRSKVAWVIR